jgi:chromate reductase
LRHAGALFRAESALRSKPVAVVGASTGAFGATWAQAELRKVLSAAGARVVEGEVALGHAMERFDDDGRLNDRNLEDQVREVIRNLLVEVEANAASRIAP